MFKLIFINLIMLAVLFSGIVYSTELSEHFSAFEKGQYQKIINELEKITNEKLNPGEKAYLLAKSYSRLQEYDKANTQFGIASKLKYETKDLHYEYGQSLFAANEFRAAQMAFIQSYRKLFKTPACLYYIGHIFQILEEYENAKEFFVNLTIDEKADKKTLQIAHLQIAETYLLMAKRDKFSYEKMIVLMDKTIIPRLRLSVGLDPNSPLTTETNAKIFRYMQEYGLDPDVMVNGRRKPLKPYAFYALQRIKYDDNVTLMNEQNNISQSLKPSLIGETDLFGKYEFYFKKKYILSLDARFNFIKYSDQSSPEVYQNDSKGLYLNIRSRNEHLIKAYPASFMLDLELSSTQKDWNATHTLEAYADSWALAAGQNISFFSFGDTTIKLKYKDFAGVNELISNHSLSFTFDQLVFLPNQKLLLFMVDYTKVDNYNNTFANTNSLLTRLDYLVLQFIPTYNLGLAFAASYVDTLKQKILRGNEVLINPSMNVVKEFSDRVNFNFNIDYSRNKSKLSDYSYDKTVYSFEVRFFL